MACYSLCAYFCKVSFVWLYLSARGVQYKSIDSKHLDFYRVDLEIWRGKGVSTLSESFFRYWVIISIEPLDLSHCSDICLKGDENTHILAVFSSKSVQRFDCYIDSNWSDDRFFGWNHKSLVYCISDISKTRCSLCIFFQWKLEVNQLPTFWYINKLIRIKFGDFVSDEAV